MQLSVNMTIENEECVHCDRAFIYEINGGRHFQIELKRCVVPDQIQAVEEYNCPEAENVFECSECSRKFSSESKLAHHVEKIHRKLSIEKLESINGVLDAESVKKDLSNSVHRCYFCQKNYASEAYLTAHINGVHRNQSFQCPYCEKTFNFKGNWQVHINLVHERKHLCSTCGKNCRTAKELKVHTCFRSKSVSNKLHNAETVVSQPLEKLNDSKLGEDNRVDKIDNRVDKINNEEDSDSGFLSKEEKVFTDLNGTGDDSNEQFDISDDANRWCHDCNEKYSSDDKLSNHLKKFHPEKLECGYCELKFSCCEHLRRHVECIHAKESQVACCLCDKKLNWSDKLYQHVLKVHGPTFEVQTFTGNDTYKCPRCNVVFVLIHELVSHILLNHSDVSKFSCHLCEKKFLHKSQMIKHMGMDHQCLSKQIIDKENENNPSKLDCIKDEVRIVPEQELCVSADDEVSANLDMPVLTPSNNENIVFAPPIPQECGTSTALKSETLCNLDTDCQSINAPECSPKTISTQADATGLTCEYCGKLLGNKHHLKRHLEMVHEKVTYVECPVCGKQLVNKFNLDRHVLDIHANGIGSKVRKAAAPRNEIRTPDGKRIRGKEAGSKFRTEAGKYRCPQCALEWSSRSQLATHILTHILDKNVPCGYCDEKFTLQDELKSHMRKVHANLSGSPDNQSSFSQGTSTTGGYCNENMPFSSEFINPDDLFPQNELEAVFQSQFSDIVYPYQNDLTQLSQSQYGDEGFFQCDSTQLSQSFSEVGYQGQNNLIPIPESQQCNADEGFYSHNHLGTLEPESDQQVKSNESECPICHKKLRDKYVLGSHIITNHGNGIKDGRKRRCADCNMDFPCKRKFVDHIVEIHGTDKSMLSSEQDSAPSSNQTHPVNFGSINYSYQEEFHPCSNDLTELTDVSAPNIADVVLGFSTEFHAPLQLPDTCQNIGSFQCSECEMTFPCEQTLRRHFTKVHEDFECPICDKKFLFHYVLTRHMEVAHPS